MRLWVGDLGRAARLRPSDARATLVSLGRALSGAGLTLACPAPNGGGLGASFRLDGSVTLRFTAVEALVASGGRDALARLGERMAAARGELAAIRAVLDALVALAAAAAALAAALDTVARGGPGRDAILHAAIVCAGYAALIPCRRLLLRRAFRLLAGTALRRAATRFGD